MSGLHVFGREVPFERPRGPCGLAATLAKASHRRVEALPAWHPGLPSCTVVGSLLLHRNSLRGRGRLSTLVEN